ASGQLVPLHPGWELALGAAVVLTIVQQIDNHLISPHTVARNLRLHPLTVILSLLVGGALIGLWGMLIAIPLVATLKILVVHYWDTRAVWPPRAGGDEAEPRPMGSEGAASPQTELVATPDRVRRRWWIRTREP